MRYFALLLALPLFAQSADTFADRNASYRLQPTDTVEVAFTYTPDYDQSVAVQPDGFINLKLIGPVRVGGLTLEQARLAIKRSADQRLNDPEISLQLKDFVKPHFTVAGEVTHPGVYDLRGNVSLVEAIAISGGFKEFSKQSEVVLVRRVNPGLAQTKIINAKNLMDARYVHEDPLLHPDDMLIVPKTKLGKIEPYIRLSALSLTSLYGVSILK